MEIGIGTANFGQKYGLINQSNIKTSKKISNILGLAINSKIKILDTSPNYGISEKILGKNKVNIQFITKQLEKALTDIEDLKDKVRANGNHND